MTKPRHVTEHQILGELRMGGSQTVKQLAGLLMSSLDIVQPVLDKLLSRREIEVSPHRRREIGYRIPKSAAQPRVREKLRTSIAGPAIAPDLKKNLTGYDAAMRARVELCMLARPR